MKKFFMKLLFCSIFTLSVAVSAQTPYVEHEEIINSINQLIIEYDAQEDIQIAEIDTSVQYTDEQVQKELDEFENYLKHRKENNEFYVTVDFSDELKSFDSLIGEKSNAPSRWIEKSEYMNVDYKYGNGVFGLHCDVKVQVDYTLGKEKIVEVANIDVTQDGHAMNFDDHNVEDSGSSIGYDVTNVWADVRINSSTTILGQKLSDSSIYTMGMNMRTH